MPVVHLRGIMASSASSVSGRGTQRGDAGDDGIQHGALTGGSAHTLGNLVCGGLASVGGGRTVDLHAHADRPRPLLNKGLIGGSGKTDISGGRLCRG